jgi:GrpB-like predicted nucleotidyltransferase (UPF0157 family)
VKVIIEPYNSDWSKTFTSLKNEIFQCLSFLNPTIEHIGSTSIEGLSAKPIIDLMVGIENLTLLDQTVQPLIDSEWIYFQKFNSAMPNRRFFVKLTSFHLDFTVPSTFFDGDEIPNELNEYKLAHIHVFETNSIDWNRHIAFRDYLKNHPDIKDEYQNMKLKLSLKNWENGSAYNLAKNDFIKEHEEKAVQLLIESSIFGPRE